VGRAPPDPGSRGDRFSSSRAEETRRLGDGRKQPLSVPDPLIERYSLLLRRFESYSGFAQLGRQDLNLVLRPGTFSLEVSIGISFHLSEKQIASIELCLNSR
jgi:hypothetical protein